MDWELLSQVWWLSYSVDAAATLQHVLCSVKSVKKYCSHTHSYVQPLIMLYCHSITPISSYQCSMRDIAPFSMSYQVMNLVAWSGCVYVVCISVFYIWLICLMFAFVWCGLMASCLCLHCVVFWSVWLGTSAPLLFYLIGYDDVAMLWLCHMVVLLVTTVTLKRFIWRYRPYMVSRAKCVSEWVFDLWPLVLDL